MMTTEIPPMSGSAARAVHGRGRRLFVAGMAGAHAVGLPCILGFGIAGGTVGLGSAAGAFALVLFFYGVGQWLVFRFSTSDPRTLLAVALTSFFARCALLGAALVATMTFVDPSRLDATAFAVTAASTLLGWLSCEMLAWSRLRIPVFDVADEVGMVPAPAVSKVGV